MIQAIADAVLVQWGWRRAALALAAGALSALAFAPWHLFPLLWLTVPVLVWLIDGATSHHSDGLYRRIRPAFAVGWWFGLGLFTAGLWWVGAAFAVSGNATALLAPVAVLVLAAVLALFWALATGLARLVWIDGWPRLVVLAVALTMAEWLRGHLFTGLPWNAFGYALAPNPLMMQSAAVVGLWGLTFLALLVFSAPALLARGDRRRAMVGYLTVMVGLMVLHAGFGTIRLALPVAAPETETRIRIVQPAIPQHERWDGDRAADVMASYARLTGQGALPGATGGPDVVIWPESAFPFILAQTPAALAMIADLLPPETALITGAARREVEGEARRNYNAIQVIADNGEIIASYNKVRLVPFGEYLPLRPLLAGLGLTQLVALPGGFAAGDRLRTLDPVVAPPFGPLICYEAIFPGRVTDDRQRPDWLVNVTNDGWFGATPGPAQHLHQARLRAVEEGLPMARAANTGISAIIDPHGRVVASLELGRAGVVDGVLPGPLAPTPYARFGDAILLVLLVAASVAVGFAARSSTHQNRRMASS